MTAFARAAQKSPGPMVQPVQAVGGDPPDRRAVFRPAPLFGVKPADRDGGAPVPEPGMEWCAISKISSTRPPECPAPRNVQHPSNEGFSGLTGEEGAIKSTAALGCHQIAA